MAKLKKIFERGVEIAFKTFEESIIDSVYTQIVEDDGFDAPKKNTEKIRVISDSFTQEDIAKLSFGDQIQPTDVKCLVPGKDLNGIVPNSKDSIYLGTKADGTVINETYSIVFFDTDPYNIMYTILLRDA